MNATPEFIALGAVWYVVFLLSITCHEGAHALAAKIGGDPTAFEAGQVTLNPIPHIAREPLGTVVIPILSYVLSQWMIGWASAPYDRHWEQRHPRRAAWMSLAGPAANFVLMLLAAAAIRIGISLGHFREPQSASFTRVVEAVHPEALGFLATFLSILFVLNLLLGTFNLLPVPPLDGNTGISLLMPEKMARRFIDFWRTSGYAMIGLIAAWLIYGRIFRRLFTAALGVLYPGTTWG